VTEFMSAGINNYCLDCRWQNQLQYLKSLTKCHKHYAQAHALWCAVKHDSLIHQNITYLTCGVSHFRVMTLTFNLMTFNICSASTVTWSKQLPNFWRKKTKNLRRNSPEAFFMWGFAWAHLLAYSPLLDLMAKFKLSMPSALVFSPVKLWAITAAIAIPKFKDRSRDSGDASFT